MTACACIPAALSITILLISASVDPPESTRDARGDDRHDVDQSGLRSEPAAISLLTAALSDPPPFRAVVKHTIWPTGADTGSPPLGEPLFTDEFTLSFWSHDRWALMNRARAAGQARDGPIFITLAPPPSVSYTARKQGAPLYDLLQLAVQSQGFSCSFSHGADALVALRSGEAVLLDCRVDGDQSIVEIDSPSTRRKDADLLAARGGDSEAAAEPWVVTIHLDRVTPPRVAATSFAFVDPSGTRRTWHRQTVVEWARLGEHWIGRGVRGFVESAPGAGQWAEVEIAVIEPMGDAESTPQFLPAGTKLFDPEIDLHFTIGSPDIKLRGESVILKEPLYHHPGVKLAQMLRDALGIPAGSDLEAEAGPR